MSVVRFGLEVASDVVVIRLMGASLLRELEAEFRDREGMLSPAWAFDSVEYAVPEGRPVVREVECSTEDSDWSEVERWRDMCVFWTNNSRSGHSTVVHVQLQRPCLSQILV